MKSFFYFLAALALISSCSLIESGQTDGVGELRIALAGQQESLSMAGLEIPDTSDFLQTIKSSEGDIVYDGKYGDFPESVSLDAGEYTIAVISEEFSKPAFSSPQFGAEECVIVPSGRTVDVKLVCTQINSGIRLDVDSSFLDAYPDGVLILKSSSGRLVYNYYERRIAYFKPGDVSLVLNEGSTDKLLMTKTLKAKEILSLKVKVAAGSGHSSGSGSLSVSLDTLRLWNSDTYVIGGDDGGSGVYDAMTVSEALSSVGEEEVWICGYIVGGDLSSSSASFDEPFESRTNFLLGPKSSTRDKDECLSVQVPSGYIREALNLVDNPELLGRKICIKANIVEAYYGIPGLKYITEYELF